jgi:hypothetical protein
MSDRVEMKPLGAAKTLILLFVSVLVSVAVAIVFLMLG